MESSFPEFANPQRQRSVLAAFATASMYTEGWLISSATIAAINNDAVAGQILIDAGADVNAINKDVKSPLAWATTESRKEMVKLLEMHGAK